MEQSQFIYGYSDEVVYNVIVQAWEYCGGAKRGFINFEEATIGLKHAFCLLQPVVPITRGNWYKLAFRNFDHDQTGFIVFDSFRQIIQQYHCYHAQKCRERAEREALLYNRAIDTVHLKERGNGNCYPHDVDLSTRASPRDKETPCKCHHDELELISSLNFSTKRGIQEMMQNYEIAKRCLGEGAFSRVYLAKHRQTGQLRVCKVIDVTCAQQWDLVKQEINLMRSLNHPNILRLHEAYDGGCTIFLILELCSGGPLYSRIVKMKELIMEEQVAAWMKQILSATAFCHEREIIHRDIKPENILFVNQTEDSPLKVIDFGLSSTLDKIRKTRRQILEKRKGVPAVIAKMFPKIQGKAIISGFVKKVRMQCAGTPHYMAPEMIKGVYNEKCDMFSVGVIMYQLLSGKHPFYEENHNNQETVRERILHKNPSMDTDEWKTVSPQAIHLIKWMLQKDPRKRCSAKEALNHIWFKIMEKPRDSFKSQLTPSVFDHLKEWQELTGFKRAIVRLLARELSEDDIFDLRKKFQAFDRTGDGTITLDELSYCFSQAQHPMIQEDIEKIFKFLDISHSNRIYYMEFISALIVKKKHIEKAHLEYIFNKFDIHGEGRITIDAFRLTLKTHKCGKLSEDLEAIFDQIDLNKDGYVDFYEFYQLLSS